MDLSVIENDFKTVLSQKRLLDHLRTQYNGCTLVYAKRHGSQWRAGNVVLEIGIESGSGTRKREIIKYYNDPAYDAVSDPQQKEYLQRCYKGNEIRQQLRLSTHYPKMFPRVLCDDDRAVLMEFKEGESALEVFKSGKEDSRDKAARFSRLAPQRLQEMFSTYPKSDAPNSHCLEDVSRTIFYHTERLRNDSRFNLPEEEFRRIVDLTREWSLKLSKRYVGQPIHGDLNADNLRITESGELSLIDPKDDSSNSIVKDFGRYVPSFLVNCFDYSGWGVDFAAARAKEMIKSLNLTKEEVARLRFFSGQSMLSFSYYGTQKDGKDNSGNPKRNGPLSQTYRRHSIRTLSDLEAAGKEDVDTFAESFAGTFVEEAQKYQAVAGV